MKLPRCSKVILYLRTLYQLEKKILFFSIPKWELIGRSKKKGDLDGDFTHPCSKTEQYVAMRFHQRFDY